MWEDNLTAHFSFKSRFIVFKEWTCYVDFLDAEKVF